MSSWPRSLTTARLTLRAAAISDEPSHVAYRIDRDDLPIGGLRLVRLAGDRGLRLLIGLADEFRGAGHATEAGAAVCAVAFGRVARLEVHTRRGDRGAALARRLGFVLAGTLDEGGDAVQIWRGERAPSPARAAVARACRGVAPVAIGDEGTLRAGGATFEVCAVGDQPFVVAVTDIGHESAHDAQACLAHNSTLGVGALGLSGNRLVLRFTCPAHAVTPAMIRLFLTEAERLRRFAFQPQGATTPSPWTAFTD